MITDNLGILVAGLFKQVNGSTEQTIVGMRDINGVAFQCQMYGTNSLNNMNVAPVIQTAQIGKGNAPTTRQDIDIEVPFTNGGVEDNPNNSLVGIYNPSTESAEMATAIGAVTGNGSITEVCKFVSVNDNTGVNRIILIIRDIISPVNFITGETVNILHKVGI